MRQLLRATHAKRHFSSSICLGLALLLPWVLASCSPPGTRGGLAKHPTSAACSQPDATCQNFHPATPTAVPSPTPSPAPLPVPRIEACPAAPSASCATFTGGDGHRKHVWLAPETVALIDAQRMGTFPTYHHHTLAYVYAGNSASQPLLYILDLTASRLVAGLGAPGSYTFYGTYFDYITDPRGNKYPFFAPGAHSLDGSASAGGANPGAWDFLCLFDPRFIGTPDPACAPGFKHYTATFTTASGQSARDASGFRHNGGWVQDVDGDGWGDINLPYLSYILTLSGRTGHQLGLSHIEPGAPVSPPEPPRFDSGRLYGAFTQLPDASGHTSVLIAAANAVGTFTDVACNVSRYFMLARWDGGMSAFTPAWNDYLGFGGTVFSPASEAVGAFPNSPRHMTGCIHRYSNALEWIGGRPTILYNHFKASDSATVCETEWLAYVAASAAASPSTSELLKTYAACVTAQLPPSTGQWSIRVIDAWTGQRLGQTPHGYVWGRALNVIPAHPKLLLIQRFTANGAVVAFNQTDAHPDALEFVELASPTVATTVAVLRAPPSAPRLGDPNNYYGARGPGYGATWGGLPELVLKDIDGDGLNDIQLKNGQWIGYAPIQGTLVIKG